MLLNASDTHKMNLFTVSFMLFIFLFLSKAPITHSSLFQNAIGNVFGAKITNLRSFTNSYQHTHTKPKPKHLFLSLSLSLFYNCPNFLIAVAASPNRANKAASSLCFFTSLSSSAFTNCSFASSIRESTIFNVPDATLFATD